VIRYTIQDGGEMIQDTRYRIPDIILKIYDVSGRIVKSFNLESCIMYHESVISWDGTGDSGRRLPPGVYFVYLTNGSLSAIKKVIKLGG
jgi:flagellar hook assembly protein FlgD